jgi:hypothetical protein
MLKLIVSGAAVALASMIAARRVHSPAVEVWHMPFPGTASGPSPVVLTAKVAALARPTSSRAQSTIVTVEQSATSLGFLRYRLFCIMSGLLSATRVELKSFYELPAFVPFQVLRVQP